MTSESNKRNMKPFDEIRRLISARCDNRISPEELNHLEKELAKSPDARAMYIDYLDLHASLGWEVTARQPVEELALETIANGDGFAVGESARRTKKAAPSPHRIRSLFYMVAAALLAVAGFGIWWAPLSGPDASPSTGPLDARIAERTATRKTSIAPIVARILDASPDCKWFVENRADNGDRTLRVGETLRYSRAKYPSSMTRAFLYF